MHDARVFRNSPLRKKANQLFGPDDVLVGDAGYPLRTFLLTPFRDTGHLTAQHRRYNKAISSTRVVIEQAFGRLKNRCVP